MTKQYAISREVREMIQPGRAATVTKSWRTSKLHILAIVDSNQVVFRQWVKNQWVYSVKWIYLFQMDYMNGYLEKAKK